MKSGSFLSIGEQGNILKQFNAFEKCTKPVRVAQLSTKPVIYTVCTGKSV